MISTKLCFLTNFSVFCTCCNSVSLHFYHGFWIYCAAYALSNNITPYTDASCFIMSPGFINNNLDVNLSITFLTSSSHCLKIVSRKHFFFAVLYWPFPRTSESFRKSQLSQSHFQQILSFQFYLRFSSLNSYLPSETVRYFYFYLSFSFCVGKWYLLV